jgi:hypothetical protein
MVRMNRPEPVIYNSLGLQALCQRIEPVGVCDILELGPARTVNVTFWSRYNPSIYVADLRSSLPLPPLPESEESEFVEPDWDRMLGLPADRTYDVVLAWDLLNYLELPVVASMIRYLKPFCRPGTILFTLIFDQKQMPDEIALYKIADESHLRYEYVGSGMRTCPRHRPHALEGVMNRFKATDSFRLRNGVIEYLFVYGGDR